MTDAIAALPYRQRAAVVLRFWHDASEAEIAAALGCRPGTVGSLIHRALRRARPRLARGPDVGVSRRARRRAVEHRRCVLGSRPVFRDLVFLSATCAAVQYETEIPGYPAQALGHEFGEVVFVDGRWKLTRESVCRDVQLVGVTCP